MEIRGILTATVLILALITISTTAAAISCDCGDICANETGWWRDGGAFNASGAPIQAAVNAATVGETICVAAGSYTENVDITKRLTLAGEGAGVATVTAADSGDHVFEVTADYVNISGFNATGATSSPYAGIYLNITDHCNISENTASGNYFGISLLSSSNNTLTSNNCSNNLDGIYLYTSCNNTLSNNRIYKNYEAGIYLEYSNGGTITENNVMMNGDGIYLYNTSKLLIDNNTLQNNTAQYGGKYGDGIRGDDNCTDTIIRGNIVRYNNYGIDLDSVGDTDFINFTIEDNVVEYNDVGIWIEYLSRSSIVNNDASNNNDYGIYLEYSSNNTLLNNTANSNNYRGIYLYYSSNNTLLNNTANSNNYRGGIYLDYSSNNTLLNNTANSNNYFGIRLDYSSNNTLLNNNYSNNTQWDIYTRSSDSTFTNNTLNGTTISFVYGGDVLLKGVGSPAADPAGQQTVGKFINAMNQSAGAWLFLNFSYSDADVSGLDESDLAVWRHNGTMWLEDGWNGTRYLDTVGNVVGANITSFSVFAPAAPKIAANYIPPDPINLANTVGNYWVNYTWSAGIGNATDSYNVSMNEGWTNGTANTFANTSVGHEGWANITVFAYNVSGTGTLSEGSVSDAVQAPATPNTNTIPLLKGWNLISAPLNLTTWELGQESVVGDPLNVTPENSLSSIYRYNTTSELFEKCTHYLGWGWAPATGSENFTELEPGRGYWVMAEGDCDLTFTGTAPSDPDVLLDADWNCIGWYSTSAALLGEEAIVGDPLNVTPENSLSSIYRYNTTSELFEKCTHYPGWGWAPATGSENFTELEPGRGYWVMAKNDCVWRHEV